jgi:hypothetical protein
MFNSKRLFVCKLRLALAGAAVILGGGAAVIPLLAAGPASAISPGQVACSGPGVTITPANGYVPVGPAVHVNDGTASSTAVELTASADANVTPNAEMRLSWSIDGAAAQDFRYGPGNFAENQQFAGTRTVVDVATLGPGAHSIQPEIRISGNATTSGTLYGLCTLAQRTSN